MKSILALMFFLSIFSASAAKIRPELTYFTEQFPPYNYVEDQQVKGISFDLLHLVWQRMRIPKQKVNILPWERAYYLLQQQPNSVLFMTMKTPLRSPLFKWACPIISSELHFIGNKGDNFKFKQLSELHDLKVAATRAAVGEQLLLNNGFPIAHIVATDNLEQSLKLLLRGRVDLVISEIEAVDLATKELGLEPDAFMPYLLLSSIQGCFAFNKSVPDEFVQEFASHLKQISASPLYDGLLKRYNLSKPVVK